MEPTRVCHVAAIPYPGRGHVNPMMNICRQLAERNPDVVITVVVTEEWLGLIGPGPRPEAIRFATVTNVIPSERVRAGDMAGFVQAVLTKLGAAVEEVLDWLEPPVSCVVADCVLSWAVGAGNRRNVPVASLWTMSASLFSVMCHFRLLRENGHFPADLSERGHEVIDYIPGISPTRLADLPLELFEKDGELKNLQAALRMASEASNAQYLLCNSVHDLEPRAFHALKARFLFPVYPIGPTIPDHDHDLPLPQYPTEHLRWLDSQPEGSVLYVSFGSFLSVPATEIEEVMAGIRASGVRWAWTGRADLSGAAGVVVVPGRDQLRALGHRSVGGFWTHCGWNSVLEGIFSGVPMLTFPIFWDQFLNSKLVVEDWKVGLRVRHERGLVGTRDEIAETVKRFMDRESCERKLMVERVEKLREHCRRAIARGGFSNDNLDAFVRDIARCSQT